MLGMQLYNPRPRDVPYSIRLQGNPIYNTPIIIHRVLYIYITHVIHDNDYHVQRVQYIEHWTPLLLYTTQQEARSLVITRLLIVTIGFIILFWGGITPPSLYSNYCSETMNFEPALVG